MYKHLSHALNDIQEYEDALRGLLATATSKRIRLAIDDLLRRVERVQRELDALAEAHLRCEDTYGKEE
jgi:hypothetical protein